MFFGAKFTLFWTSAENDFIYFVISLYDMPASEWCNGFFTPVKRWATSDKAKALRDFSSH